MSTMTDREMLEWAARAAGIEIVGSFPDDGNPVWTDQPGGWWGPLNNDGDALRLAVALGIKTGRVGHRVYAFGITQCDEYCNDDAVKAARRAITRAAAEIGRSVK